MTPQQEINNPECSAERWWELAEKHPIEAMQSPLYPLLVLFESPARWVALERTKTEDWYDSIGRNQTSEYRLSNQAKRLLAVECAERVLPFFETKAPDDKRPHESIHQATLCAFGLTSQERMADANANARLATSCVYYAAYQAAYSAVVVTTHSTSNCWAVWAASHAAGAASLGSGHERSETARTEFFVWAWRRALEFLFAPNQLPSPWDEYAERLESKGGQHGIKY